MGIPTEKSTEINQLLSDMTGKDRMTTIISNQCMMCTRPAVTFKDDLSRKEYTISGMCQTCQDSVFEIFDDLIPDNPQG